MTVWKLLKIYNQAYIRKWCIQMPVILVYWLFDKICVIWFNVTCLFDMICKWRSSCYIWDYYANSNSPRLHVYHKAIMCRNSIFIYFMSYIICVDWFFLMLTLCCIFKFVLSFWYFMCIYFLENFELFLLLFFCYCYMQYKKLYCSYYAKMYWFFIICF